MHICAGVGTETSVAPPPTEIVVGVRRVATIQLRRECWVLFNIES